MKTIKHFTPVILQALFMLIGFLLINSLAASDTTMYTTNIDIVDQENEQELEQWMLDPAAWSNTDKSKDLNECHTYTSLNTDDEIILEPWMLNPNDIFWSKNLDFASTNEEDLILEDWMTNTKYWLN